MSFWSPEYSGLNQEGEETEGAFLQAETRATLTNIFFFASLLSGVFTLWIYFSLFFQQSRSEKKIILT